MFNTKDSAYRSIYKPVKFVHKNHFYACNILLLLFTNEENYIPLVINKNNIYTQEP